MRAYERNLEQKKQLYGDCRQPEKTLLKQPTFFQPLPLFYAFIHQYIPTGTTFRRLVIYIIYML